MRTLYPKLVQGRIQDYFSGGEAPLRNGVTEGEVKKNLKAFISGGCATPAPSPWIRHCRAKIDYVIDYIIRENSK